MRRLTALLAVAVSLAAAGGTAVAAGYDNLMSVESQFICTTCHEPLELVSSPQALSEKAYLESLLRKQLTTAQVKAAMVSQYGVAVLARPPASGFNLTVYILPPAVLVGGLALLAYTLPKWRRRSRLAAVTPMQGADPLRSEESARLDAELKKFI
jgi:cytochrome c-type biogenesis protein CcmH/NrfF